MQRTDELSVGALSIGARSVSEVDLADPFYFDHPLDHVPGIMLIVRLLGLVREAGGFPVAGGRLRATFSFLRFCELDAPAELRAWPAPQPEAPRPQRQRQWGFAAEQGPVQSCVGAVTFLPDPFPGRGAPVAAYRSPVSRRPIAGQLVHRRRPENILLGQASREDAGPVRCAVLSPPSGDHLFRLLGGGERGAEELIEAARQATVMLWGTAYGRPADTRLTLNSVSAELPVAVDRDRPLELRWWPGPIKGNKALSSFELVAGPSGGSGGPELIGSIDVCMQAWTDRAWARVRSGQRLQAAATATVPAADAPC